ncbi:hypothetical protein MTO96_024273 [Rhipicephalus appendiculatus]
MLLLGEERQVVLVTRARRRSQRGYRRRHLAVGCPETRQEAVPHTLHADAYAQYVIQCREGPESPVKREAEEAAPTDRSLSSGNWVALVPCAGWEEGAFAFYLAS